MQKLLRGSGPAPLLSSRGRRPNFSASFDEDQIAFRQVHADPRSALCTIVGIDGGFSRRLGGQLAIAPGGATVGNLSDGCLEKELAAQALALKILNGGPACLRFGKGSPFIDFRLPCASGLDILLDPDLTPDAVGEAAGASEAQISRIRSPIGLIKKARDARLLALSVLSEIVQDYKAMRTC